MARNDGGTTNRPTTVLADQQKQTKQLLTSHTISHLHSSPHRGLVTPHRECFYGTSLTVREAVLTWRYWLLFLVFLVVCGSGLLVIYNISDIAQSSGVESSPFYVTIFALGNGLGKVAAGMASDYCVRHRYLSAMQLLGLVSLSMTVLLLLMSIGWGLLTVGCFFWIGMANGCAVSLVSVATLHLFGPTHIATTLALMDTAPLCGSFAFSTALVTMFYHANALDAETGLPICLGGGCFRYPLYICSASCFVCASLCYFMHAVTFAEKSSGSSHHHRDSLQDY